ncbi:hypothetical protein Hypma_016453 [Hypsizygus marmoreus]|uniref:Uncharacterized protein n=1 Tax=Hypsizygus marmoreus TaxID=39966 RepID=A0A369J2G0_HYPMA|nr:hypothetical protein Hypma_016453 [Hypsizygus marmoreus]
MVLSSTFERSALAAETALVSQSDEEDASEDGPVPISDVEKPDECDAESTPKPRPKNTGKGRGARSFRRSGLGKRRNE